MRVCLAQPLLTPAAARQVFVLRLSQGATKFGVKQVRVRGRHRRCRQVVADERVNPCAAVRGRSVAMRPIWR